MEENNAYERFKLFTREQKGQERLSDFYGALAEQATKCELGALEKDLVKDLFIARMQKHTDLQKKFIMEKTTSDKILQEIVLYERGVDTSASFHTTSTNSLPQIKTELAFAIDSKRKFSKQSRQQNRGGVDK